MAGRLARILLPAVLVGALALPALPDTTEDEGVIVRLLQTLLSEAGREVRIRGFEGALSSRATIREITIADSEGVWITLSGLVIDWNRGALLDRQVEVNELSATRIEVHRAPITQVDGALPNPTAGARFALPELPVSIRLGTVRAEAVHLGAALLGQEAEVRLEGAARLAGGQGETLFTAQRIDGEEGTFRIQGAFDNVSRNLALDIALDEGQGGVAAGLLGVPGRPALGLTVQGEGPLETFAARIALATDGVPRVQGRFSLIDATPQTDFLQGGGFALDLSGDLRPLLAADLHPFFGEVSSLRATGSRNDQGEVSLPILSVQTGALTLEGSAALRPDGLPRRAGLVARLAPGQGDTVLLPGTGGAGRLASATLDLTYDEAVSRDWSVRAALEGLDLPGIDLAQTVLDARGRLNPSGTAGEPLVEGVFEFAAEGLVARDPAVQQALGGDFFGLASLTWPGPGEPVDLTGLAFEGATLSLTAHGEITDLAFDGFAEFAVPDLSAFSALAGRQLGGDALVTLEGHVDPLTGALDIEVDLSARDLSLNIPEADAFLAGESGISLSLARDTEGTVLRGLSVVAGTAELDASGTARPDGASLRARLTVQDMARLGAGWGGRLVLESDLLTDPAQARLRLDGSLIDLELGDLPGAAALAGLFRGATRLRADLTRTGEVTQIGLFTLQGPHLGMSASGAWSEAAPDVTLALERLALPALAAGATGDLTGQARLAAEGADRRLTLALTGAAPMALGLGAADGLLAQGLTMRADATLAPDGALSLREAALRAGGLTLQARGALSAAGTARFALEAALADLAALVPGIAGPAALRGALTRTPGADRWGIEADLTGPAGLAARIGGQVRDDRQVALALSGQVEAAVANPAIEPNSVQGLIRFDGTLNGPPSLSSLDLQAQVQGGRLALPVQYLAFQDVTASARLRGPLAQVQVEGVSQSGGAGVLSGTIRLDAGREADLSLRLTELLVQQPNLFQALVSGQVRLTGRLAEGPLASGRLDVSRAEIRIPNSPLARAGVGIAGLTHVAEGADSRRTRTNAGIATGTRTRSAPPPPLRLDLTLTAPGRIFVRGRGLDAELGGTLRLGGAARATVPAGSFQLIRGRLDLLGNRFVLTDGSASMVGSFLPFISLTATTESDGVSTSVTIAGQANSPEITFSSNPELPQDEVLARLIFRRSLASLSPFQAAQLALSVATLTGRADDSLLSRTREAMGLDDLDFRVNSDGETELRAGRAISETVYTGVGVTSDGRGEVTINLDLTPSVTLRGRADTEGGSGIGLFFERDY